MVRSSKVSAGIRSAVLLSAVMGASGWTAAASGEVPATRPALAPAQVPAPGTTGAALFDPARHMRVADVRPGMKGYCLTVFSGTKIERFEVEVVSVMRNQAPGLDAVMITCTGGPGKGMEHLLGVEGMSGSPVYVYGDDGKPRLLGAFAFGFSLSKDPLIGVQPIENMLAVSDPAVRRAGADDGTPTTATPTGSPARGARARWTYGEQFPLAGRPARAGSARKALAEGQGEPGMLRPIGLSLSVSGLSTDAMRKLEPMFAGAGLRAFQAAPAGVAPVGVASEPLGEPKIEPGSTFVVPLVTGDMEMAALGTCTEVLGDRAFGFGHQFQGDGGVELPLAAGYVNTIVANLNSSFKVGASTRVLGTLKSDTTVGVAGLLGAVPETVPVSVRVRYADGSLDRTYRYRVVRHPRFTPLLTTMTVLSSLSAQSNPPAENTMTVSAAVKFATPVGGAAPADLRYSATVAGASAAELFMTFGAPLVATTDNPFSRAYAASVDVEVTVEGTVRAAEIVSARATRARYEPGEKVAVDVTYRPFRASERVARMTLELPKDLAPGEYTIAVSDLETYRGAEAEARPDRLAADSLEELLAVLREQTAMSVEAVYLRLGRDADGVAVGRTAMPRLPGSRRQMLGNAGVPELSDIAGAVSRVERLPFVMSGAAEVKIEVVEPATRQLAPRKPRDAGSMPGGSGRGGMPGGQFSPSAPMDMPMGDG